MKTITKKYFENSVYVLSNEYISTEVAEAQLSQDELENAEFIEHDDAVASHYGYDNCAVFHINEEPVVETKINKESVKINFNLQKKENELFGYMTNNGYQVNRWDVNVEYITEKSGLRLSTIRKYLNLLGYKTQSDGFEMSVICKDHTWSQAYI